MRSAILRLSMFILVLVSLAATVSGEELVLELDPKQTKIHFLLDATGHDVHGSFRLESGEIRFDAETGAASGEIRVDATGSETGNESRDKKMHEKVLESAKFPTFILRVERFVGPFNNPGASHVELHGQLEILGLSHPVVLVGDVKTDAGVVRGKASFEIPYVEWGLHDPSVFVFRVAKKTDITVELVGELRQPDRDEPDTENANAASMENGQEG